MLIFYYHVISIKNNLSNVHKCFYFFAYLFLALQKSKNVEAKCLVSKTQSVKYLIKLTLYTVKPFKCFSFPTIPHIAIQLYTIHYTVLLFCYVLIYIFGWYKVLFLGKHQIFLQFFMEFSEQNTIDFLYLHVLFFCKIQFIYKIQHKENHCRFQFCFCFCY